VVVEIAVTEAGTELFLLLGSGALGVAQLKGGGREGRREEAWEGGKEGGREGERMGLDGNCQMAQTIFKSYRYKRRRGRGGKGIGGGVT